MVEQKDRDLLKQFHDSMKTLLAHKGWDNVEMKMFESSQSSIQQGVPVIEVMKSVHINLGAYVFSAFNFGTRWQGIEKFLKSEPGGWTQKKCERVARLFTSDASSFIFHQDTSVEDFLRHVNPAYAAFLLEEKLNSMGEERSSSQHNSHGKKSKI